MHDYLLEILANKAHEVAALKTRVANAPHSQIARFLKGDKLLMKKSFKKALQATTIAVIAEIKRKSPSKGELAEIRDPITLAQHYITGGAAAISVLTDDYAFNGTVADMNSIATAYHDTNVAILRKDFILDEIQIAEAAAYGANAVLLIVAVLGDKTARLLNYCKALGIDALVEVHSRDELDLATNIGAEIIGVNNRNLTTFAVDIENAVRLKTDIPNHVIAVAESGIHSIEIAQRYAALGYNALLIGEALVKSNNPQQLINNVRQLR